MIFIIFVNQSFLKPVWIHYKMTLDTFPWNFSILQHLDSEETIIEDLNEWYKHEIFMYILEIKFNTHLRILSRNFLGFWISSKWASSIDAFIVFGEGSCTYKSPRDHFQIDQTISLLAIGPNNQLAIGLEIPSSSFIWLCFTLKNSV